jgi:transposase-like protein
LRFGVVGCPTCRRVQTLELRVARPRCRGCGTILDRTRLRHFYQGDDEQEARRVAVRVAAQADGMPIEELAQVLAVIDAEQNGDLQDALAALSGLDDFDVEDLAEAMRAHRVRGDAAVTLERLLRANRVYEPRLGRYRFV